MSGNLGAAEQAVPSGIEVTKDAVVVSGKAGET